MTEKKFTDRQTNRQTNIITEKAKTIYPLYTSYRGYNNLIYMNEKNDQIKGLISNMWLFFCYTIQLITIKLCTKFQNPKSSRCSEIFDRKKMFTDRQTNRQTNIITEKAKTIYPLYTSYQGYNKYRGIK